MDLDSIDVERLVELQEKFPGGYPIATDAMILMLKDDSINWSDFSVMKHLTCVNHRWVRYTTKNPWERSIFSLQGPHGIWAVLDDDCGCPFTDLRYVKVDE
jgi:hypothetical protein